MFDLKFYQGKKVLVTGHTGFKGSWMCKVLTDAGADVTGYALNPPTEPALFTLLNLQSKMNSVIGDIRDFEHLQRFFAEVQPDAETSALASPMMSVSSLRCSMGSYPTSDCAGWTRSSTLTSYPLLLSKGPYWSSI